MFSVFGSWPIPDSNEPYYIGKAIHYWDPDLIPNDTFLESKDSHLVFYLAFGWLTFFFSPAGMAQIGRWTTWFLLAWSWRRLSFTLIPMRFAAILTATALAYYVDSFHMAGEWIIGGVEGKSFAFPLVFFGLEAAIRGRWNRAWIFLGAASAFHVLVGGWTVLVVGFMRLFEFHESRPMRASRLKRKRWTNLVQNFSGLFLGGLLALPGLIPALLLDSGSSREIVHEAHRIYVFERLYHHLVPSMLPWTYPARFVLLAVLWWSVCRSRSADGRRQRRFDRFIVGTLILWGIGFSADYGFRDNRETAAEILRFYWFRLADVAVPMGVAVGGLRRLLALRIRTRCAAKTQAIDQPVRLLGICAVVGFALYLLFDHLVFGVWFFSWTLRPEPGIPWLITLVVCFILLAATKKKGPGTKRPLTAIGLVCLYGAILLYAPWGSLTALGDLRTRFAYSRIDPTYPKAADDWINVCRWIRENTPKTAKFWVPREGATFQWNARRSDVGVWKNIPQDAAGIVAWNRTMRDLFSYEENGTVFWDRSLTINLWWKTNEEIERLRKQYGFEFIVCGPDVEYPHLTSLRRVYPTPNHPSDFYAVYRVLPLPE